MLKRVRCVEKGNLGCLLTVGEYYSVFKEDEYFVKIIDNFNGKNWFPKELFEDE